MMFELPGLWASRERVVADDGNVGWVDLASFPAADGLVPAASLGYRQVRQSEIPGVFGEFDKGWQDRVALEFEIINDANLEFL